MRVALRSRCCYKPPRGESTNFLKYTRRDYFPRLHGFYRLRCFTKRDITKRSSRTSRWCVPLPGEQTSTTASRNELGAFGSARVARKREHRSLGKIISADLDKEGASGGGKKGGLHEKIGPPVRLFELNQRTRPSFSRAKGGVVTPEYFLRQLGGEEEKKKERGISLIRSRESELSKLF